MSHWMKFWANCEESFPQGLPLHVVSESSVDTLILVQSGTEFPSHPGLRNAVLNCSSLLIINISQRSLELQ